MDDLLSARDGVRDLLSRYTDAVWRNDYQAFGDCFTDDAEWRISGKVLGGRREIIKSITAAMTPFRRILIKFENPIVSLDGQGALSRVYLTEHAAFTETGTLMTVGAYYDRVVCQGERWRFSWRLFDLHYVGPPDLSGTFYDNAEHGPPPAMPRLDAVPPDHFGQSA